MTDRILQNMNQIKEAGEGFETVESGMDRGGIGWSASIWMEGALFIVDQSFDDGFRLRRTFTKPEYAADFIRNT